ncbi:choice-of-anchor D domain-containing protein [bacterium]|nr:choice-of-anchor D domain-containing protein [bacterium]
MQKPYAFFLFPLFFLLSFTVAEAQQLLWDTTGVAICTADGWQRYPRMVTDGSRGAIIVWEDIREGSDVGIYAARVTESGATPWQQDGVQLSAPTAGQRLAGIVSDGSGGAFIAWWNRGGGDSDIFMQRIDSSGSARWQSGGITICDAEGRQEWAEMISDGRGGVIITWHDTRGGNNDIYAQRVSRAGAARWDANGVVVSAADGDQSYPQLATDQNGGAYVAWMDRRTEDDIYAQHVRSNGTTGWEEDLPVCVEPNRQVAPKVVPYGAASVAFFWQDYRLGPTTSSLYLQVIDSLGGRLYQSDYEVSQSENAQSGMFLTDDGEQGALAVWTDYRQGVSEGNVYMRRIAADGTVIGDFGNALCDVGDTQERATMISDGNGGGFAVWQDRRNTFDYDIYMNRISAQGLTNYPAWNNHGGVLVVKHDNNQLGPQVIESGPGYALICWYDGRTLDGQADIYAQRVAWAPSMAFPDTVDFGIQKLGLTAYDTVRVFNEGATPMIISNVRRASDPGNTHPRDFTLYPDFPIPDTLLHGEYMDIPLSFTPEGTGDRYSELRISSNAPQDPVVIPLIGVGTNPELRAKNVHQFNVTKVGAVNEETVQDMFTNTGSGVLLITEITFEGKDAARFSLGPNTSLPLRVEEGSSIPLTLRFAPDAIATYEASMVVSSNEGPQKETVRLTGFGAMPSLSFIPVGLHFDSTMETRSAKADVQIRNTSGVVLVVTNIEITGEDADQFSVEATLPMQIAGEANKPFTVHFSPTSVGFKRAKIVVTSDATSSPDDMVVDGAATVLAAPGAPSPSSFAVESLFPQPLRAGQTLQVRLATPSPHKTHRIELYNVLGRQLATLYRGSLPAENATLQLSLADVDLVPGIYILRFHSGKQTLTRRFSLIR